MADATPTDWLTARQARPLLGNCCVRTVHNHMLTGTRTTRGVILLRCQVIGGRRLTTRTWVAEYLAAIDTAFRTATATTAAPVESPEKAAERGRQAKERAAAKCRGNTTQRARR